jgi:hypothetical protein
MPSAGLTIADELKTTFAQVKEKKGSLDFMIMKMDGFDKKGNPTKVIVESKFPATEEDVAARAEDVSGGTREDKFVERVWNPFMTEMKKFGETKSADGKAKTPEPRYAVVHAFYEKNGRKQDRVLFIAFCPESCSPKLKMPFSSTKQSIKPTLEGCDERDYNFTEAADFDWQALFNGFASA